MQAMEAADQALFKDRRAVDFACCQLSFMPSWIFTVLQRAMVHSSNLVAQEHCRAGVGHPMAACKATFVGTVSHGKVAVSQ